MYTNDENTSFIAADYDNAIKKVSLAEQLTDISDIENAKKTRKARARRALSSENSDDEEHPPQKKSKKIGGTATKAIESNIYPEFPTVSDMNRSPLISIENNGNLCIYNCTSYYTSSCIQVIY